VCRAIKTTVCCGHCLYTRLKKAPVYLSKQKQKDSKNRVVRARSGCKRELRRLNKWSPGHVGVRPEGSPRPSNSGADECLFDQNLTHLQEAEALWGRLWVPSRRLHFTDRAAGELAFEWLFDSLCREGFRVVSWKVKLSSLSRNTFCTSPIKCMGFTAFRWECLALKGACLTDNPP